MRDALRRYAGMHGYVAPKVDDWQPSTLDFINQEFEGTYVPNCEHEEKMLTVLFCREFGAVVNVEQDMMRRRGKRKTAHPSSPIKKRRRRDGDDDGKGPRGKRRGRGKGKTVSTKGAGSSGMFVNLRGVLASLGGKQEQEGKYVRVAIGTVIHE